MVEKSGLSMAIFDLEKKHVVIKKLRKSLQKELKGTKALAEYVLIFEKM